MNAWQKKAWVGALALWLAGLTGWAQNQFNPGMGNNTGQFSNGNMVLPMPRVSVAPSAFYGVGGLRSVTRQTPTLFYQNTARSFFAAGGIAPAYPGNYTPTRTMGR